MATESPTFTESNLPQDFSLGFILEPSSVSSADYETKRSRLVDAMANVFVLGERNFIFFEDCKETPEDIGYLLDYQEGLDMPFEIGRRHRSAFLYVTLKGEIPGDLGLEVMKEDIDEALDLVDPHTILDDETRYNFLLRDACDQLEVEGYEVEVLHERGVSNRELGIPEDLIDTDINTRNSVENLGRYIKGRQEGFRKQLDGVTKTLCKGSERINIMTVVTIMNSGWLTGLPPELRKHVVYSETGSEETYKIFGVDEYSWLWFSIGMKLGYGEEISDAEWTDLRTLQN